MESILVVDDDPGFRKLLETILTGEGYRIESAASIREAVQWGGRKQFQLVICDLKLPDGEGLAILEWFRENAPETAIVMITAYGSVATAVEAMKLGAADYIGKPLASPEELRVLVRNTLAHARVVQERDVLREEDRTRFHCDRLIARDARVLEILELARKVAPTNATVLITGESGTGKEVLARCIHSNSPRADRVFIAVNCAALAPTLIESELFGHERGAFTGAVAQHLGRFERAHGGTVFLDEVAELDGNLQAKLLRVLQERTFERVGGTRQISVDVRVIAATNRNLNELVEQGKFREDLFYRLNAFPLQLPPLRERRGDIPELARWFLSRAARNLRKPGLKLTPEAEEALAAYDFPGNIRELENLMERTAILCEGEVTASDLPLGKAAAAVAGGRPLGWKEIERRAIEDALRMNRGNRTRAARQLGISLRTLQYRLKEYGQQQL